MHPSDFPSFCWKCFTIHLVTLKQSWTYQGSYVLK